MITPDLRAVGVGWEEGVLSVRFLFDRAVTSEDESLMAEVESEVAADFGDGTPLTFIATFEPGPGFVHCPGERWWAYVRRE
jgi:hypothetical protein